MPVVIVLLRIYSMAFFSALQTNSRVCQARKKKKCKNSTWCTAQKLRFECSTERTFLKLNGNIEVYHNCGCSCTRPIKNAIISVIFARNIKKLVKMLIKKMTHKCMALFIIKPIWFHMHTDTSLRSSFDKIQLVTSKYVHMRSLCEILFTSILPHLSFVFSPRCVFVYNSNCFTLNSLNLYLFRIFISYQ